MDNVVAIMAKQPVPGLVKTRMCPPLNEVEAAKLYKALLRDTLELVKSLRNTEKIVAFSPETAKDSMRKIVGIEFELRAQRGADLGERLRNLFQDLLSHYKKVIVLGSDSPTLPTELLEEAFAQLDYCDVVLGPCLDGGYYLVGSKTLGVVALFENIDWGTNVVFKQTVDCANSKGLTTYCLKMCYDVDTWADVEQLVRELESNKDSPFFARWTKKFLNQSYANWKVKDATGNF